jgi:O-antigen ligase
MESLAYGALWIFIFAVPWENMIVIPGFGTISKLLGMLALGCALFAALVSGRVRRFRLFHVSALVFVLWAGASVYRAVGQQWAFYRFATYLQLFVTLWMIWQLAPGVRRQRGLMLAYVLGASVASFATILVFRSGARDSSRFAAAGFDANDLGTILALALPMAWYLGMTYQRPLLRWVCRAYMPLGVLAIGLTASRGAMLVAIVALMIVPMTMTRLSPGKMMVAMLLLVASGAIATTYIPERSLERLSSATTEVEAGRFGGRGQIWKMGMLAFAQKPLLGWGAAGFTGAVSPFLGYRIVAHNTYLTVLVEQGILGFIPWAMMFIAVIREVRRLPYMERRFGLVLLATLGIAIFPLTWDDRKPVWFILALLAAFSAALLPRRPGPAAVPPPPPRRPARFPRPQPAAPAGMTSRPSATPTRTPFRDA